MKRKKLTGREIDQALEKIRELYDHYMVRYIKGRSARKGFEERYNEALRARIDLDRFLSTEVKIIKQMIARAEEELKQTSTENGSTREEVIERDSNGRKMDFADRVIEKMKKKVSKYPVIGLESSEVWEVDHLFGALQKLDREIWPGIDRIYRKIYPSRYDGPRIVLENRLQELAEPRMGGTPQGLHTLQMLLGRFPRNYREIEWEVKQTILKSSFFLHTLKGELEKLLKDSYLAESDRRVVESGKEYVDGMIEDFRLKDLKQK